LIERPRSIFAQTHSVKTMTLEQWQPL